MPEIVENSEEKLTELGCQLFGELYEELTILENRIKQYDSKIEALARADERCVRLQTIPGIGPITATALLSSVGNANLFTRGRQLSAYLEPVPFSPNFADTE